MSDLKWSSLKITIQALSPVHIGEKKLAIVELTRRYLPGKSFWGALTSILAKEKMTENESKESKAKHYEAIGNILKDNLCFSYFYVCDSDKKVYLPAYSDEGYGYIKTDGNKNNTWVSDYDFDKEYIKSYVSTAIDNRIMASEDNSLHEIEYFKRGTYFTGYIFYKKDGLKKYLNKEIDIKDYLQNMLALEGIGGNRSRGFGRMRLHEIKEIKERKPFLFFSGTKIGNSEFISWEIDLTEQPKISLNISKDKQSYFALMPIKLSDDVKTSFKDFKGDLQPIVGRNWSKSQGAGQFLKTEGIFITPGSSFTLKKETTFKLTCFGYLIQEGGKDE